MNKAPVTQLVNPFVGLRPFEESEDYLFFGRGRQIDELLKKFSNTRFLAVIGASGSGKSSLVKSGLLPSIYSGFMKVGSSWRVALMQPGENPIGYLTNQLAKEGTLYNNVDNSDIPYGPIIEASLRRSENGLVQVYKDAHLPEKENLLIVVDQFEELFRFSKYEKDNKFGKSDAIHFVQILLTAVQQAECPVYVLLTMRSDFLGDCAEFRGLPEAINKGQYLVPRMTRDEIREAITGPVAVSGATISQRLVTRLLNDINNDTDQLPILQHAMMRTWDAWYKRDQHDTPIDLEDYEKIGTMKYSLSQHADEAYAELNTGSRQKTCELMFKALTDKAADSRGIRRPRSITDLCLLTNATQDEINKQVEIFRKPGRTFLMPPPYVSLNDNSIIDISHESLMRVWDRLVKWTEEEARSGDIFVRLSNSALLKEQGQRGLLKNPELAIAIKWKETNKPTPKWAEGYKADFDKAMVYLEESRVEDIKEKEILAHKEATRKRLVKIIFALLGLLLIAALFIASWFRIKQKEAEIAKQEAEKAKLEALNAALAEKNARDAADILRLRADSSARVAIRAQLAADSSAGVATEQRKIAEDSAIAAREQRKIAEDSTVVAREQRKIAERNAADARNKNLKIAANEYARLIHEGPSAENKNQKNFYGKDYFLAYRYHFDVLKDSVEDRAMYEPVRNKLYYNNELYQRLCENFAYIDRYNEIIQKDKKQHTANDVAINSKEVLDIIKNSKPVIPAITDKNKKFILWPTGDNFIYVYNNNSKTIDSIAMGAKVTALDMNEEGNIIYFGTASGYIGYIDYTGSRKKYQPVFENKLNSEISAIQLFRYNDDGTKEKTFLLAVAKKSNSSLYKLNENHKMPDKRLVGNELPYKKEYGEITGARFDNGWVILFTTKGNYAWNPFTVKLLEALKQQREFNTNSEPAKSLIIQPDIKFY